MGVAYGLPSAVFGDDFALGFDALEVFAEEFLHRAVEIEAVFLVVEAVSLVVLDHVVDMHAAFAQGVDHLVALVNVHTGVVGALYHQQRGFDPFGVECRGVFAQHLGVSNLFSFLQTIPPYWKPMLDMMYEMVGDPVKDKEMMEKYSPVFHVDQIKAPLFVAQGANDPRVNKAESDQMVEALKKRGIEVEYMVKDNEGHGFHNEENKFDFYRAMDKFLSIHLKK